MIGLGLSIVQLAVRAGLGFARGSSLALDFTSGNRTLDPRITFSRTTNATVTGSNGLIQNAPMNLLTHSEQFDNAAWSKASATAAANTTAAPNGTVTADTISLTSNLSTVAQTVSLGAGTYTFSVWVKTLTFTVPGALRILLVVDGGSQILTFTPTAEWTRQTFTVTAATSVTSVQAVRGSVYVGDIAIWGAQLEVGSTATTYNPTTVKNLLGFTENFDNAAWTKSNAFVQTNLLLRSEEFDSAAWSKTRVTVTANATASPDGTVTADKLVEDTTASASHFITAASTSFTLGVAYTLSMYAKAGERNQFGFNMPSPVAGVDPALFNLETGAVIQNGSFSSASITPVGNGWFRCIATITATGTASAGVIVRLALAGATSYTGDGTSGVFIWGAQLVQGTTPGDYKATYATAAAVGYTDIYGQPFAQKFVPAVGATTATAAQAVAVGVAPYTVSFRAKAAEQSVVSLVSNLTGVFRANIFNLAAQTVSSGVGWTASITPDPSGNGWFICSCTATADVAASKSFQISNNSAGWTGDGTSGIYIFGAQLSDSASVDPYVYQPVAAPASTAYYGPRFDYDPVTLAPKGLLIEEQRTQLLLNSVFNGSLETPTSWLRLLGTDGASATSTIAPSVANAWTFTASGDRQAIYQVISVAANTTYSFSVYVEENSNAVSIGQMLSITNQPSGAVVTIESTPATAGSRLKGQLIVGATAGTCQFRIGIGVSNNATGTVRLSCPQLEIGAFATSFIPSAASQVTRAADSASMIGNNFARWYTQGVGTFFAQSASFGDAGVRYITFASDASNNNRIAQYFSTATMVGLVTAGGTAQAAMSVSGVAPAKTALAYATDNFAFARNAALDTDSAGTVPVGLTQMQIGAGLTAATSPLNGTIARFAYYNRRLADSELIGITS